MTVHKVLFSAYVAIENELSKGTTQAAIADAIRSQFYTLGFSALTLLPSIGTWELDPNERGFKIEAIADEGLEDRFVAACGLLAHAFGETCIAVSVTGKHVDPFEAYLVFPNKDQYGRYTTATTGDI